MALERVWNKKVRTDELGHAIPEKTKNDMVKTNWTALKDAQTWLSSNKSAHYGQVNLGDMPTEAQAEALFDTKDKTAVVAFLNGVSAGKYKYLPWLLPLGVRSSMRKAKACQIYRKDSYGGKTESVTSALTTPIDFAIVGTTATDVPQIYAWDLERSHIGTDDFVNYFSGMITTEISDTSLDHAELHGYINKTTGNRVRITQTVKTTKKNTNASTKTTKRGLITSN